MPPSKYEEWTTENGLTLIRKWAREGFSEKQIAGKMGVSFQSVYTWKKKCPELVQALKEKQEVHTAHAETALVKSCTGYYVWEEKWRAGEDGEMYPCEKYKKWVPPNVTALIFYLKNRGNGRWADKVEQEISGKNGGAIDIRHISDEDLDKRIAELEAKK